MPPFPLYRAAGTHRQLGQQHGEQASEKIVAHVDLMGANMKLPVAELRERVLVYRPLFEEYSADLVEEIAGLAEGAGIPFADALATNVRGGLPPTPGEGCTAFAITGRGTATGETLAGQNSDMSAEVGDLAYVLHLQPEGKPEVLMYTFGGMIGYHGFGSTGVAHFANALGGGPAARFALPHYPLKRLMLECAAMDEVVALVRRTPLRDSGNYVLCDGRGAILDIEATPDGPHLVQDEGAGFLAHSNHFLCPEHATAANYELSAADSFTRLERMNDLIASRFGEVTIDDCKAFLRDRDGDPAGICRQAHPTGPDGVSAPGGITVASVIADPARRALHVAAGNEPDTPFTLYRMDAV